MSYGPSFCQAQHPPDRGFRMRGRKNSMTLIESPGCTLPLAPAGVLGIFIVDTDEEHPMRTSVQKWGNSLAIRIPKPLAEDSRLLHGTEVELTVERGRLVAKPLHRPRHTLDALLAGVTPRNRHREIDTGSPLGRELW